MLGIALDGSGYGGDGTIWGGEFLLADYRGFSRLGAFRPTPLPGGTQAILQPWRNSFSQLESSLGWARVESEWGDLEVVRWLRDQPLDTLRRMMQSDVLPRARPASLYPPAPLARTAAGTRPAFPGTC